MRSINLQTTARVLQPLILFISVFLLVRGHDEPGGGFVGGLTAASAFVLHALAYGIASARRALPLRPPYLAAAGLAIATGTLLAPMLLGRAAAHASWTEIVIGDSGVLHVGTPLVFDVGVYLVVFGSTLMIVLGLGEE